MEEITSRVVQLLELLQPLRSEAVAEILAEVVVEDEPGDLLGMRGGVEPDDGPPWECPTRT